MATDRTIMVATDLSARSDRPFERSLLLANELQASILVLHVPESEEKLDPDEEQRLCDLIQDEFGLTAASAEIIFEYGSAPSTIARVAEERGCFLIITGVARFNSPTDYILGTAVDDLVRHSSVPVLVVKRRARRPYKRLLVTCDFSDCAVTALLVAARLFPDADLRLVHAFHAPYEAFLSRNSTVDFVRGEAETSIKQLVETLPAPVRQRLETAAVEDESLAAAIDRTITDWGADLLVLGSHGRSSLAHATIGSQAANLLACEPCDILVVREPRRASAPMEQTPGQTA